VAGLCPECAESCESDPESGRRVAAECEVCRESEEWGEWPVCGERLSNMVEWLDSWPESGRESGRSRELAGKVAGVCPESEPEE